MLENKGCHVLSPLHILAGRLRQYHGSHGISLPYIWCVVFLGVHGMILERSVYHARRKCSRSFVVSLPELGTPYQQGGQSKSVTKLRPLSWQPGVLIAGSTFCSKLPVGTSYFRLE